MLTVTIYSRVCGCPIKNLWFTQLFITSLLVHDSLPLQCIIIYIWKKTLKCRLANHEMQAQGDFRPWIACISIAPTFSSCRPSNACISWSIRPWNGCRPCNDCRPDHEMQAQNCLGDTLFWVEIIIACQRQSYHSIKHLKNFFFKVLHPPLALVVFEIFWKKWKNLPIFFFKNLTFLCLTFFLFTTQQPLTVHMKAPLKPFLKL